jgi:hypothetical protein
MGATLFGWVLKKKDLTPEQLAAVRFVEVTAESFDLDEMTHAAPFVSLAGPLPPVAPRSDVAARAAADNYPRSVVLVRESVKGSYWKSSAAGTRHLRKWGYLDELEGFSTTYDYGAGGEICAELAHVRAVRAKLSSKRMVRRGEYRMLKDGEAMPTSVASKAAVGTAAVSHVSQHDSESASDSEDERETDSEDDACQRQWDA